MFSKERNSLDQEYLEYAEMIGRQLIRQWDIYPKQLDDGSYVAIHEPLTDDLLLRHLKGEITLGTYVLDQESNGHFMVLDADNPPDWRKLIALSIILEDMECPSYLETSRRGGHLWLFMKEKMTGKDIRNFGDGLMDHFGIKDIEMFPKQDQLTTGPGSLIRLPFGIHRKSGRRYGFVTRDLKPIAPTIRDQIKLVCSPDFVPEEIFNEFHTLGSQLLEMQVNSSPDSWGKRETSMSVGEMALSDRIKAAMPVRQFVLQYVELSPRGMGLCPFHEDNVESFSVNDQENYWRCFAGCGGGSIIDFYMKWNDCDFVTAIRDLARELL